MSLIGRKFNAQEMVDRMVRMVESEAKERRAKMVAGSSQSSSRGMIEPAYASTLSFLTSSMTFFISSRSRGSALWSVMNFSFNKSMQLDRSSAFLIRLEEKCSEKESTSIREVGVRAYHLSTNVQNSGENFAGSSLGESLETMHLISLI